MILSPSLHAYSLLEFNPPSSGKKTTQSKSLFND